MPNQTSGTVFVGPLKIQAVKDIDGVCTGIFTGDNDINLSQENVEPGGNGGLNFTISGNNIAKHPIVTNTTLNFGANSIATIPAPIYKDAGKIRLHANYNEDGVSLSGSSNNSFWVIPDELVVTATSEVTKEDGTKETIPLNGATAVATPTHKAGESFDLTVSAFNSLGNITPNYSPGQIQFKLERIGPKLEESVDGYLTQVETLNPELNININISTSISTSENLKFKNVTLTNFSAEGLTNVIKYSEVGLINLDVQDSDYGKVDIPITISAEAIDIGRFIPDHFKQTVEEDGSFTTTCVSGSAGFAYSGQKNEVTGKGTISYVTNPILAITAYNKQGSITLNYYEDSQGSANDYMKLNDSGAVIKVIEPTSDGYIDGAGVEISKKGVDGATLLLTADMHEGGVSSASKGVVYYQFSNDDNFFYNRSANALVIPFESKINFSIATIEDADSVDFIQAGGISAIEDALPTGVEIRFGRLVLENNFGPETSNLPLPMQIEHFVGGTSFVVSDDNNCTSYDADKITLTNFAHTLPDKLGDPGNFINGKTQAIELKAPGAGNQGTIDVTYDAYDWLKYDWDNDGNYDGIYDDNPSAIATFGIFRGND